MEKIEIKNRAIELYKRGDSIKVIKIKLGLTSDELKIIFSLDNRKTKINFF